MGAGTASGFTEEGIEIMRQTLRDSSLRYEFLEEGESPLTFRDIAGAMAFLRQFSGEPAQMAILRDLAEGHSCNTHRLTTDEILKICALQLVNGRIRLLNQSRGRNGNGVGEAAEENVAHEAPSKSQAAARKTAWVEFRVIDDETGQPVEAVELTIKLPDGRVEKSKTDMGGYIEINDTVEGNCLVNSDITEAQLSNAYGFVRFG
jgi:hypothetical protein